MQVELPKHGGRWDRGHSPRRVTKRESKGRETQRWSRMRGHRGPAVTRTMKERDRKGKSGCVGGEGSRGEN